MEPERCDDLAYGFREGTPRSNSVGGGERITLGVATTASEVLAVDRGLFNIVA